MYHDIVYALFIILYSVYCNAGMELIYTIVLEFVD